MFLNHSDINVGTKVAPSKAKRAARCSRCRRQRSRKSGWVYLNIGDTLNLKVDPEFAEDYLLFSLFNPPSGESTDIPYGPENANPHRTRSNLEPIEVSSWLIGGCS